MKPSTADIAALLTEVAPELDAAGIAADADLINELDIDSMDFLEFVVQLAKKYAIEVPESDYPRLATLSSCADYVAERTEG